MKSIKLLSAVAALVMIMAGAAFSQTPQTAGMCPCVANTTPVHLSGTIESVSFPTAVLKTSQGQTYTLQLGPWWYWENKGYKLNAGESVSVDGFLATDGNIPNVVLVSTIHSSSGEIKLRDDNGYPLWGRGPRRMMR